MGLFESKQSKELNRLTSLPNFDKQQLKREYAEFKGYYPKGMSEQDMIDLYKIILLCDRGGNPTDYIRMVFKTFNKGTSPYLSFADYKLGLNKWQYGTKNEKIAWSFSMYDQRHTGKLSYNDILLVQKEVYKMYGTVFKLAEDESTAELKTQKIFKTLSKDIEDTIDFDEFKRLCMEDYTLAILERILEAFASRAPEHYKTDFGTDKWGTSIKGRDCE